MPVTKSLFRVPSLQESDSVAKKKLSVPTVLARIHQDVDEMAEMLCGAFKKSKPDFISDLLRPLLEKMKKEATDRINDFKMLPPPKK